MTETRLVCRVCGDVFSEHEVRLAGVEPEAEEIRCPNCGSPQMEPYPFDPNVPDEVPVEEEEREA